MSMFGFGRPQPSSAEKIAAAEQEMDMITDMFNKYVTRYTLTGSVQLNGNAILLLLANDISQAYSSVFEEVYPNGLP